jgi:hypothetical protein
MAAEIAGLLSAEALLHPAFDPLRPWLRGLSDHPKIADLNALAAETARPPVTATGHRVVFWEALAAAGHYEQKIFDTGVVDTRPDNLHDLFNGLAWLAFPQTKAAINARHVERIAIEGELRGRARGPLRDLLTLVDEGGVIVACEENALPGIETLIREFRWRELFWDRRIDLLSDVRFVLTGHNAYEKALAPYPGITCKAIFVATPIERIKGSLPALVAWLDGQAAAWIKALPDDAKPRQMAPLPVFGYPGWLAQSTDAAFYADRRWFRARPGTIFPPRKLERVT